MKLYLNHHGIDMHGYILCHFLPPGAISIPLRCQHSGKILLPFAGLAATYLFSTPEGPGTRPSIPSYQLMLTLLRCFPYERTVVDMLLPASAGALDTYLI